VQVSTPQVPGSQIVLRYPNGTIIRNSTGSQVFAVDNPHYLGPLIIASRDKPVRVKFTNYLPTGVDGNLFIPVDTNAFGAGTGPNATLPNDNGTLCSAIPKNTTCFSENRATIHLHGGNTPGSAMVRRTSGRPLPVKTPNIPKVSPQSTFLIWTGN